MISTPSTHPVGNLDQFTALLKNMVRSQEARSTRPQERAARHRVQITLGKNKDRDQGVLGIEVVDAPWAPFAVDFHLANVAPFGRTDVQPGCRRQAYQWP